jgi:hypothetical protein
VKGCERRIMAASPGLVKRYFERFQNVNKRKSNCRFPALSREDIAY